MRKLREVLRLHSLGLSQHQIARSCSISQSTVHDCLSAAQAAGLKWPLPEHWGDQQFEQALFPNRPAPAVWHKHPEPDWTQIHKDLQTHRDPESGEARPAAVFVAVLGRQQLYLRRSHRRAGSAELDRLPYAGL